MFYINNVINLGTRRVILFVDGNLTIDGNITNLLDTVLIEIRNKEPKNGENLVVYTSSSSSAAVVNPDFSGFSSAESLYRKELSLISQLKEHNPFADM